MRIEDHGRCRARRWARLDLLAGKVALVTGGGARTRARHRRAASPRPARAACCSISSRRTIPCLRAGDSSAAMSPRKTTSRAAVARVRADFGRLDVAVANAGIVPPWHDTETIDLAEWDRVFAVNARGVMATIKHAVPLMKAARRLHRRHGFDQCLDRPSPSRPPTPRASMRSLGIVRAAALRRRPLRHPRQRALPRPGRDRRRSSPASAGGRTKAARRSRRLCERYSETASRPHGDRRTDVVGAALFLASDLSSGITGHLIPVDAGLRILGGRTRQRGGHERV